MGGGWEGGGKGGVGMGDEGETAGGLGKLGQKPKCLLGCVLLFHQKFLDLASSQKSTKLGFIDDLAFLTTSNVPHLFVVLWPLVGPKVVLFAN